MMEEEDIIRIIITTITEEITIKNTKKRTGKRHQTIITLIIATIIRTIIRISIGQNMPNLNLINQPRHAKYKNNNNNLNISSVDAFPSNSFFNFKSSGIITLANTLFIALLILIVDMKFSRVK